MGLIRALLAISVVLGHTGTPIFGRSFVSAGAAVEIFYVISGFYMALVLNEKYLKRAPLHRRAYGAFLKSRFLRLYPTYGIIVLATVAVTCASGEESQWFRYASLMRPSTWILLVVTNLTIIGQDSLMFMGLDPQNGLLHFTTNFRLEPIQAYRFLLVPQAWTLGLEIAFYLLAPLLVRRKTRFILMLMLLSIGTRVALYSCGLNHDPWTYRFFPCELVLFLTGILLYRVYERLRLPNNISKKVGIGALLGAIACLLFFSGTVVPWNLVVLDSVPLAFLAVIASIPFVFRLTQNSRIDRFIGDLSYPMYICHMLVIGVMRQMGVRSGLGILVATIGLSVALVWLVDRLVGDYRRRLVKDKLCPSSS